MTSGAQPPPSCGLARKTSTSRSRSIMVNHLVDDVLGELHTEAASRIASQDLAYSRRLLQIGLL
jgi:hypothetical protein